MSKEKKSERIYQTFLSDVRRAVRVGHFKKVRQLVKSHRDINVAYESGFTLLHYAASGGHLKIVKFLLSEGANVTAQTRGGWQAIHMAARQGDKKICELLVRVGCNANEAVKYGLECRPLHLAVDGNHEGVFEVLLAVKDIEIDAVNTEGSTALHYAVVKGRTEIVKRLIKAGANVNTVREIGKSTPLHQAVINGHLDIVKLLVDRKANTEVADEEGYTPLQYAVNEGDVEITECLIGAGANVKAVNNAGKSARDMAVEKRRLMIVELFVKKEADTKAKERESILLPSTSLQSCEEICKQPINEEKVEDMQDLGLHLSPLIVQEIGRALPNYPHRILAGNGLSYSDNGPPSKKSRQGDEMCARSLELFHRKR